MSVRWAKMIDDLSEVDRAAADGFESVQATVGLLAELSSQQLHFQKQRLKEAGVSIGVCSAPLPAEARVTEKGFNIYVWTEYLKKALRTVAELGCGVVVWGDGRARILPVEGDTIGAKEQVLQFLAMLGEVCAQYRIRVLVEPLGPRRTNFLNSMEEVADFLPLVGKENLSSMISLREVAEIGLRYEDFDRFSEMIAHVQLENPLSLAGPREAPRADDGYDYKPFLEAIHQIRYDGVITLPQNADIESLRFCRMLWSRLG